MIGWIKMHRKITEWEWYTDSKMVHLFLHLLLTANREKGSWRGVTIERGQLLTGVNAISKSTGISTQSIRTRLSNLEQTSNITIKSTNKYSIITICNYDDYQDIDCDTDTNQQTNEQTNNNRTNYKQEDKKDNSIKNTIIPSWKTDFSVYLTECKKAYNQYYNDEQFIRTQSQLNPNVNVKLSIAKGFENFWGKEAGWKHKKKSRTAEIDWRQTIVNSIGMNKVYYTKQELSEMTR